MKLNELQGSYDAVFSLGQNCLPAMQMEKNNLRPFAGVLDWMISDDLADVNRLLRCRFYGMMDLPNMRIVGYDGSGTNLMVKDEKFNVTSVHDFPISRNTLQHLATYPEFMQKLNRRIHRFLGQLATAKRLLFVRMHATEADTRELQALLSAMCAGEFHILVVNYTQVEGIVEQPWAIDNVCAVEVPYSAIWNYNGSDSLWKTMFEGVMLV
ncbi:peptidase [Paenibacillus athensensis]|uniref:Peptidase n=1 Tax=Paenibacillus athensensis TaxID=1967502 RepID=A0A4Y8PQ78_9BACL|nr:DUF1796 family putative cysteine peptidase [Paenibacillus athensensis]MCD1258090.1 peptidase [Paenibacillus athensensis]